ncbi:uncharacterized protein [Amphiura filiformis]|uniref:uncharacterized protein n=1 Tax=Amphiura filiformis TaxID=82378 RepID=UPI003B20ECEB
MAFRGPQPVPPRGQLPLISPPGLPPSSEVSKDASSEVKNPEPISTKKLQPPPPGVDDPQFDSSEAGEYQDVILDDDSDYDISENQDDDLTGQEPGREMMGGPPAKKPRRNIKALTTTYTIKNLDRLFAFGSPSSMEGLHNYFDTKFGHVKSAEITQSKRYAVVHFDNSAAALAAFNGGIQEDNQSQHSIEGAIVMCVLRSAEEIEVMKKSQRSTLKLIIEASFSRDEVEAHFSKFGPVEKISYRDSGMGKKTFGSITYKSLADAQIAFLCGDLIGKLQKQRRRHFIGDIYVNVQHTDCTLDKQSRSRNKLFAFGFQSSMQWADHLHKYFNSKFGHVNCATIPQYKSYAIVHFDNSAAALAAFKGGSLVGSQSQHSIEGAIVTCVLRSEEEIKAMRKTQRNTLELIGVDLFSRDELEAYFSKFGPVEKFSYREDSGMAQRGFEFGSIKYKSHADAEKAFQCGDVFAKVTNRRRHYIGDKYVTVQHIVSMGEKNNDDKQKSEDEGKEKLASVSDEQKELQKRTICLVAGGRHCSREELEAHFSKYGPVDILNVCENRFLGSVVYKSSADADKAFQSGDVYGIKSKQAQTLHW